MKKILIPISIIFFFAYFLSACQQSYSQGAKLYEDNCGNCHGKEGLGLRSLYPPIAKSDYLEQNFDKLPCIITKGISTPLTVNGKEYSTPMTGLTELSDIEIANIVNHISSKWYPNNQYISLKDINVIIGSCK